jgi:Tat protein secretion system quality control protein TatD with DNase activity
MGIMKLTNVDIRLSYDEYDHASEVSRGIRGSVRRMPLTDLLIDTEDPVRFGEQIKSKMITPSVILLLVEAIAQLKDK